ncbi:MAG: hypothetical protein ACI89X_003587 [Planctomycetota bacterium]|jgi:hypothetical protein
MLMLSLAVLLHMSPQSPQGTLAPPVPTVTNLGKWLTFIEPAANEQTYREVGWRNALWPAVQEARKLGRPILLWTMNGHPLGCT